jgi:hypothetical protein
LASMAICEAVVRIARVLPIEGEEEGGREKRELIYVPAA